MEVLVERYIEQVVDGLSYKGHVKIGGTKLTYELVFAVPIPRLDTMEMAKDEDGIRRLFQIKVRREHADIELTKDEYGFFFSMLVEFAADFHDHPQTRGSNMGMLGAMLRGVGSMSALGASMTIGVTSEGSYELPAEICEMLTAPKFGCVLTI